MKRESKRSGINLIPEKAITVFRRGDKRVWELTAPDAERIRCQCGSFAVYGRTVNGSAPFFYECRECLPSQYLTPASPTAIGSNSEPQKDFSSELIADMTWNGYHLRTLSRLAHALGRPVDSEFAEFCWRLSNEIHPPSLGSAFMTACGYIPFEGFPLKRN